MAVTGVLRWAGLPPEHTLHAGFSYVFLTAALVHALVTSRTLRARLRLHGRRRP